MAWKKIEKSDEVIDKYNFETLLFGMFDKKRFLDIQRENKQSGFLYDNK